MAVGIVHHYEGGTEEQYRAVLSEVHPPGGLPAGQTHHWAGPAEGGWLVVAIWDSPESLDAFMSNELMPALERVGDAGFPGPPQQTSFQVANAQTA